MTMTTGAAPITYVPKFAYVANSGSNDVSVYTISQTTGSLTPAGTVAAGTAPQGVAVDPTGEVRLRGK